MDSGLAFHYFVDVLPGDLQNVLFVALSGGFFDSTGHCRPPSLVLAVAYEHVADVLYENGRLGSTHSWPEFQGDLRDLVVHVRLDQELYALLPELFLFGLKFCQLLVENAFFFFIGGFLHHFVDILDVLDDGL